MIGSQKDIVDKYIQQHLKIPPKLIFDNCKAHLSDNNILIQGIIKGTIKDLDINIAILENKSITHITKGENTGLDLLNTNIVREFYTFPLSNDSIFEKKVPFPKGLEKKNSQVVVYLQNRNSLVIEGGNFIQITQ